MATDNQKPKFFETHNFKKLKDKWYGKLEKSGFKDIEHDEDFLQNPSTPFGRADTAQYNQSKEEYYRLAGHFLHDHKFTNDTEKRVWELHQSGVGTREIARRLPSGASKDLEPRNTVGGFATNVKKVQSTIRRLAKEMIDQCNKK